MSDSTPNCPLCHSQGYVWREVYERYQNLQKAESRALAAEQERDKALALVASYDRQDELIGTEFEGVDEVTEVIRLLKEERDQLKAELQQAREAVGLKNSSVSLVSEIRHLMEQADILERIEKEKK